MSLSEWLDEGRVKRQRADRAEIRRLLAVVDRDLTDADVSRVSLDRRTFLDSCRRARNQADYDRIDVVSQSDLRELLEDTLAFRSETLEWLKREHPELA